MRPAFDAFRGFDSSSPVLSGRLYRVKAFAQIANSAERWRQPETPVVTATPQSLLMLVYFGAFRSQRRAENLARVDGLRFEILDFTAADARSAGLVRADLLASGTPIGPYDTLIAAQALSRDLVLVTHNSREFAHVRALKIEDWEG